MVDDYELRAKIMKKEIKGIKSGKIKKADNSLKEGFEKILKKSLKFLVIYFAFYFSILIHNAYADSPVKFTYQGNIRQEGILVTGEKNMEPLSPKNERDLWYDESLNILKFYVGSKWVLTGNSNFGNYIATSTLQILGYDIVEVSSINFLSNVFVPSVAASNYGGKACNLKEEGV